MEDDRWLRPNPWRYALLAGALTLALAGLAFAGSLLRPADRVVTARELVEALLAFGTLFAATFSLGYLCERRMAWRVGRDGIAVFNADGRQVAFLTWAEVSWVRVFPLGVVMLSAPSGRTSVWCLVAVGAGPARWLRDFAGEQLRHRCRPSGRLEP